MKRLQACGEGNKEKKKQQNNTKNGTVEQINKINTTRTLCTSEKKQATLSTVLTDVIKKKLIEAEGKAFFSKAGKILGQTARQGVSSPVLMALRSQTNARNSLGFLEQPTD